ncbi:MAG TPA: CPBP family intramembrane glutamic endopeptidase [Rhizomicrobium sp.]|nr:CPBP family intramembrane glutamic endopeptidase [Rhizomicrobium sp.]
MGEATARTAPAFRINSVILFLVLGFLLSWYPWAIALYLHRGNGGPNPLGLFVAALIASAVAYGWRGVRDLLLGFVRIRMTTALAAIIVPLGAIAVALAIAVARGDSVTLKPPPWSDLFDRFVFTFLFVALGEEPGWRGFLLPQLQRVMPPVAATLIVAGIWAFWHLPLMGTEFAWPVVPAFVVSVFGGAIFLSWLYNSARGSIILPMITHTLLNTVGAGYAFHLVSNGVVFWWIYAGIWLAIGLSTIALTRWRLGVRKV